MGVSEGSRRIARLLIDSPLPQLDRLFDYAIPAELAESVAVGTRVKAPLRTAGRVVEAYVVEIATEEDAGRALSELDSVVTTVEMLPPRLYRLARAVADRAAGSASDVLRLAVPKRMVRAEKAWRAREGSAPPAVDPRSLALAHELLSAYPELVSRIEARARLAVDAPPRLAVPGFFPHPPVRTGDVHASRHDEPHPDPADAGAVAQDHDDSAAEPVPAWAQLLAAAATTTLAAGRSAVIAVPDHRDLDHLALALSAYVPADSIVRHDAGQTGPERYAGYLRTLEHAPCIVIGNRSAVYAPVHDPGLVALWDDGDPLFEEPLAPYVHARDAALVRQGLEECALLFLGHTRTSDVQRLVEIGWVAETPAARRESANVVLSGAREEEHGARIPSSAFRAAKEALGTGPVLVQVARPGFAPTLVCADCRASARCAECGGPLHARSRGATPVCTWCGRSAHRWTCASCSSTRFRLASSGSERTAEELGRAFAGTRVIVSDGEHQVREVDARPALVVATRGAEPIARDGYRAVLLLDGERMLQSPDLRIGESCLRWWSNAAALAASGAPVHLAGVDGPVARALASWTHSAYARQELADRGPLHMPPAARVARLEGESSAVDRALAALREDVSGLPPDAVLGPVPLKGSVSPKSSASQEGASDRFGPSAARALVRFDYSRGAAVAASLRATVVSEAVAGRGRRSGDRRRGGRTTLAVRLDVLDPEL